MLAVTTIPWVQLQATTQLSMRTQRINILPASHDQEMKFCGSRRRLLQFSTPNHTRRNRACVNFKLVSIDDL